MSKESGFTLVEFMVVTAIVAILAGVAVPAYINYINRARQTEAVEGLLRAKMDQEAFWAENNRYADTIGCLYSFGNTCSVTSFPTSSTQDAYFLSIIVGGGTRQVVAQRLITTTGATDILTPRATAAARPAFAVGRHPRKTEGNEPTPEGSQLHESIFMKT